MYSALVCRHPTQLAHPVLDRVPSHDYPRTLLHSDGHSVWVLWPSQTRNFCFVEAEGGMSSGESAEEDLQVGQQPVYYSADAGNRHALKLDVMTRV